jgi:hypothetical protein
MPLLQHRRRQTGKEGAIGRIRFDSDDKQNFISRHARYTGSSLGIQVTWYYFFFLDLLACYYYTQIVVATGSILAAAIVHELQAKALTLFGYIYLIPFDYCDMVHTSE